MKSGEKLELVGKSVEKCGKVWKSSEEWGKVGRSGQKYEKLAAILDDQKSLSIAFLAISDQYATLIF